MLSFWNKTSRVQNERHKRERPSLIMDNFRTDTTSKERSMEMHSQSKHFLFRHPRPLANALNCYEYYGSSLPCTRQLSWVHDRSNCFRATDCQTGSALTDCWNSAVKSSSLQSPTVTQKSRSTRQECKHNQQILEWESPIREELE